MRWELSSIRTRVAQQLLVLFVACALAPLCAFAALASWMVATETRQQMLHRLRGDAKAAAMAAVDRLTREESRLRASGELLMIAPAEHRDRAAQLANTFQSVSFIDERGTRVRVKGNDAPRVLSTAQERRLRDGHSVAMVLADDPDRPQVELAVPVASSETRRGHIVARTSARALWDLTDDSTLPFDAEICVLDDRKTILACSEQSGDRMADLPRQLDSASGVLTWRAGREEMLGAYWSAPMLLHFDLPHWTFVVARPAAAADATTVTFRRAFTTVVVLTLTGVIGVALRQIRRRLEPLERLQEASRSIRAGDFDARVAVSSGDEFEALAESFNLMAAEVQRQFIELKALNVGTLEALARTIDAKSPWTAGHSQRVAALGVRIGREMRLPEAVIEELHHGGLLHDIGKLGIPAHILDKDGPLTAEEFRQIRMHPELGARILEPIAAYAPMLPIVLEHHERLDGSGYPRGLSGDAISLAGRIFAVADVVDAMSSDRPYRSGLPFRDVAQHLSAQAGRHFDRAVVDAFMRTAGEQGSELPYGTGQEESVPRGSRAEALAS